MKIYLELNTDNDLKHILNYGIDLSRITPCIGSYKGIINLSYEIDLSGLKGFALSDAFNIVLDLAIKFNQESILVVYDVIYDNINKVDLVFTNPEIDTIQLGAWKKINSQSISQYKAWTKINNKYMIVS